MNALKIHLLRDETKSSRGTRRSLSGLRPDDDFGHGGDEGCLVNERVDKPCGGDDGVGARSDGCCIGGDAENGIGLGKCSCQILAISRKNIIYEEPAHNDSEPAKQPCVRHERSTHSEDHGNTRGEKIQGLHHEVEVGIDGIEEL